MVNQKAKSVFYKWYDTRIINKLGALGVDLQI